MRRRPPTPQNREAHPPLGDRSLGQALVETAILLPILLILVLGAIDFGRAFFGYVNLHQAVRNGANFAGTNSSMDADDRDRYVELIENDLSTINCDPEDPIPNPTYTRPDGTPTGTPVLGDYAILTLQCNFSPLTPMMDAIVGDPLEMRATATFPVREGCINCPTPAPAPPASTPLQCFEVPAMIGLSVGGAREAWTAAGFDSDNFSPVGQDTDTVEGFTVTENDPLSNCEYPAFAIFSSSVAATTLDSDEPCLPGEAVVPNVVGMTLADARTEWDAVGFDPLLFRADGGDPDDVPDQSRVVETQTFTPSGLEAGVSCASQATTEIDVVTGEPYPEPPPAPCQVPNMIQLTRSQGELAWVDKGFLLGNFSPGSGNFTIRSQSLVGGPYVTCDASVTVAANP